MRPRKAMNASGVTASTPSTKAIHPSHCGRAPLRATAKPYPIPNSGESEHGKRARSLDESQVRAQGSSKEEEEDDPEYPQIIGGLLPTVMGLVVRDDLEASCVHARRASPDSKRCYDKADEDDPSQRVKPRPPMGRGALLAR